MIARHQQVPQEFDSVREIARRAIAPLKPADGETIARKDFLFTGKRAVRSGDLPPPYLIYFLLVELLGFRDLGKFEKLAWSIPLDYEGKAFLVEHRKFGVGVFTQDDDDQEAARKVAFRLKKGVHAAQSFFKWKAQQAVTASEFNITNNSIKLFDRYEYLRALCDTAYAEAEKRKHEFLETQLSPTAWTIGRPYFALIRNAKWLAMAAVDAFFGWTEHVLVLIAVISGSVTDGDDFAQLSGAQWGTKFKRALDIADNDTKRLFDELVAIRRELRNRMAHGTFGKDGETLRFHSSAGAVPVMLDSGSASGFTLGEGLDFDLEHTFAAIDRFLLHVWSGSRKPAWLYIQDFGLDLIMTMALDGTYKRAMLSVELMEAFARRVGDQMDNAMNMDW